MTSALTKGARFSRLYIQRGSPLPDSPRVRIRLSQYIEQYGYQVCNEIRTFLTSELGVDLGAVGSGEAWMRAFFKKAEVHDVLDAITLIYAWFADRDYRYKPETVAHWRDFSARVLAEENLAYSVDEKAGVHPLVDSEFERNIATAIAGLGAARYEAARKAFQASEAKLEKQPADTKGAIRDTFEAAETLTKLISGSGKALTAAFVKGELEPRVQKLYTGDPVATMAGTRLTQSFADWVDAAHPYRHGQQSEEPIEPPEELAILLISQGASFVRWLVDLDQQVNPNLTSTVACHFRG